MAIKFRYGKRDTRSLSLSVLTCGTNDLAFGLRETRSLSLAVLTFCVMVVQNGVPVTVRYAFPA